MAVPLPDLGAHFYIKQKDPATGDFSLVRIDGGQLFTLRERVQVSEPAAGGPQTPGEESKQVLKQSLVNEFGTKKQKKRLAMYQEGRNDTKNVSTGNQMAKIVEQNVKRLKEQQKHE